MSQRKTAPKGSASNVLLTSITFARSTKNYHVYGYGEFAFYIARDKLPDSEPPYILYLEVTR